MLKMTRINLVALMLTGSAIVAAFSEMAVNPVAATTSNQPRTRVAPNTLVTIGGVKAAPSSKAGVASKNTAGAGGFPIVPAGATITPNNSSGKSAVKNTGQSTPPAAVTAKAIIPSHK